jgi:putative CocE/NonD family hydrolase
MKHLLWSFLLVCSAVTAAQTPFTAPERKPEFQEVRAFSLYMPLRDGVRIAIDVLLPKELGSAQKLPALFKISRFGRAAADGTISEEDRFWVQHGFARVLIDERGTGASFGTSRYGPETVPDLYDIVDWVVKQSWSNGRVGAIGDSVEGTASEWLAATNHPAVRAVAPWFSDYNYYTDLVRPGGIFNEWILKNFQDFTFQMDSGNSAKPVDSDRDGVLMKQAIAQHHNNLDIYSSTRHAPFLDDPLANTGKTLSDLSISGSTAALRKSAVPMLIFVSWYDAGTVQGTIQRFRDFSNPQNIFIGAWSHGANSDADPFVTSTAVQPNAEQQRFEALQFFYRYLKEDQKIGGADRLLHYYTIAEHAWHFTSEWPPKGLRKATYQLNANGTLGPGNLAGKRRVALQNTSTGESNRWHTQLGGNPVDYSAALKQMSTLTAFTTAPISEALEVTGQPILRLRLSCSQQDPSILAFLVAIDSEGKSYYLTEGHLRLLHRKLDTSQETLHTYTHRDAQPVPEDQEIEADLTLLPISVLLKKDTRLRLLLASGDDATFVSSGPYAANIFASSQLQLPVADKHLDVTETPFHNRTQADFPRD